MTLIESMMTECTRRVKTSQSDGHLGRTNDYSNGTTFMAAIIRKEDQQAAEAERPSHSEEYIVVVPAGTAFSYHEAFKRNSDNATFRITGDPRDTQAPAQSTVQIAKVAAERWEEE